MAPSTTHRRFRLALLRPCLAFRHRAAICSADGFTSFSNSASPIRTSSSARSLRRAFFAAEIAERRKMPPEDLISFLAEARIDGRKLDDEHITGTLRLLLVA